MSGIHEFMSKSEARTSSEHRSINDFNDYTIILETDTSPKWVKPALWQHVKDAIQRPSELEARRPSKVDAPPQKLPPLYLSYGGPGKKGRKRRTKKEIKENEMTNFRSNMISHRQWQVLIRSHYRHHSDLRQ
jgi:hypothetical protein